MTLFYAFQQARNAEPPKSLNLKDLNLIEGLLAN